MPPGAVLREWRRTSASVANRLVRWGSGGEERPHEGAVVAEYAAAFVADTVGFDEVGVVAEACAVLLVVGEAGEAEQGEGGVASSFGWQEVSVVGAAMLYNQLHPASGEALECCQFAGIDRVVDDAGDHEVSVLRPNSCRWGWPRGGGSSEHAARRADARLFHQA